MAIPQSIRTLIEALDEVALLVEGSRVVAANAAARALFGPAVESGDVRLAIRHPLAVEAILAGSRDDVDITGIGAHERPWRLSARPVGPSLQLVRLFDRTAERAAERMRVDFVANASHELRTPLATILGYAETLADDGDLSADMHARFGAIMRTEAKRMLGIIEDLLSLSRIEANRFVLPQTQVAVSEIVQSVVASATSLAGGRECRVTADVEPNLPLVSGDRAQLQQLLDNLVGNALRYGCTRPDAGVTVAARLVRGKVRLSVADEGEGIAREHLPRLTERFYRVDNARSRDSGGTGLGLAIVKHIVDRHNGTLDIHSEIGRGTTVTVELPVAVTKAQPSRHIGGPETR